MRNRCIKVIMLCLALTLGLAPAAVEASSAVDHSHGHNDCWTQSMWQLKDNMRRLWTDHAIYTQSYIVSATSNLPDKDKVLERLLRNQQDIGNAIKPYYGEAAGNKLSELLREHILLAGQITGAAMSGNQADLAKFNKAWYQNADDMAKFLSGANPNWSYKELKSLLDRHLGFVATQLTTRLAKDWDGQIKAFDDGLTHLYMLSDTLTNGIIKQFPDKFK
ncbi:glycosyltransferase [Paenibacillus albus]|uniref:Glycosyltransferase n=1 Tax=Paenibacillus albus TaxID=2495582 RepID=A0A3S9A0R1_9BACL|nr:glycosyltransferase [Paenibacillus albus]AZN39286.1 glycosyltransferase [Paenibacillus albus]